MATTSFRAKLLLAIAAVATAATVATMVPAQRALQASNERFLHERFREQVAFAGRLQEDRVRAVTGTSRGLARSVRLLAAMQEGDVELIYDNARDELRDVLPRAAAAHAVAPAAFVRFCAADGHLMEPPAGGAEFGAPAGAPAAIVQTVRAALAAGRDQEFGWVAADPRLYELVITTIEDPVRKSRLGALVLGFDARPGEGFQVSSSADLALGLRVGETLYLDGIGTADRAKLASALAHTQNGELRETIAGVPHLILSEPLEASPSFPPAYRIGLYSLEGAIAERRALRLRALSLLALTLGAGLLAGALLAHGLAIPVRSLAAATRRIREGDFTVRVARRSRDELGQLTESFNEMAEGLALKERYRHVLDVVADREVAERLIAGDLQLGGETRDVSVVFCDIRGFTALARRLPPNDVVALLNEHMTALTRIVYEHGGVVDKFVGDLLMAVFGAPRLDAEHAARAVRCAQGMIRERERLNQRARHRIDVGVAVVTGEVVAGCTGSSDRLSYTVLGTPVNLVARLCALARAGEIVIDGATRELVTELATEPMGAVELKGFDRPVLAYRVTAPKPQRVAEA